MKFYRPILFVILIAAIGVAGFTWSSWQSIQRTTDEQKWIAHTQDAINHLDKIWILVNRNESAMRAYATTGKEIFIVEYDSSYAVIQRHTSFLKQFLSDNRQQLSHLTVLDDHLGKKLDFENRIRMLTAARPDSARLLIAGMQGKRIMDDISATLTLLKLTEETLLHDRTLRTHHTASKQFNTIIAGACIAFIFVLMVLLRLNRDVLLRKKTQLSLYESERRYREFIENAGMVSFTSDSKGCFTFISNQVEALTGFSASELLGNHFTTLIDKKHVQDVINHFAAQRLAMTHESTVKFPIITKTGETRWVEQDTVLLQKNGQLTGYQSVVKDVTEETLMSNRLLEMEREQEAYQARIRAILDNTPLAIYVKDLDGKYILVNRQFREVLEVTDEGIIGKTIYDLQHDGPVQDYIEADRKVIETGKPVEIENVLQFADGPRHMLTIKFPLFDHNNRMFGISGFMKDISEMVRNREELINARQRAEAAEMLQEQFLANMSHEIRTPMNGIIGMTSMLQKTTLQQDQTEYVEIIKQSSDNLLVLINDILDLSKIKAGKISFEKIPFHLASSLNALTATFMLKAKEKKIHFAFRMSPAVPVAVSGDPHRLNQILANLLSNAMKFTSEGFVTLEVDAKERDGDQVVLSFEVKDTGIGIEEKNISYIFENFTQASSSTTRKYGGTGLGLAITRRLVEMQNGEVIISSAPGKGSTFTVNMPFTISSLQEVDQVITPFASAATEKLDLSGKKVLVVEDNEINRIVLGNNLRQYNLNVVMAVNGFEAVQWVKKRNDFDLILMDLHMPEMDGFEATERIRIDLNCDVPIVVISASALKNERQKSLEIGANDYLAKPFKPEELQQCLAKFLGNARVRIVNEPTEIFPKSGLSFDLSNLFLLADVETITVITEMFENIVPESLQNLKDFAAQNMWDEVRNTAHKLKSSLGVIQIHSMLGNMAVIERSAFERKNLAYIHSLIEESIEDYKTIFPLILNEVKKEITSLQN